MVRTFATSVADQAIPGLKDNPQQSRKNELLDKWHQRILTYEESLELKFILENEAKEAEKSKKALIVVALVGLGLYLLSRKE